MIQDELLILVGFHLRFPSYGSVFNLNSGGWTASSEFLSQLRRNLDRPLPSGLQNLLRVGLEILEKFCHANGSFVKIQIHVKSHSQCIPPLGQVLKSPTIRKAGSYATEPPLPKR